MDQFLESDLRKESKREEIETLINPSVKSVMI